MEDDKSATQKEKDGVSQNVTSLLCLMKTRHIVFAYKASRVAVLSCLMFIDDGAATRL